MQTLTRRARTLSPGALFSTLDQPQRLHRAKTVSNTDGLRPVTVTTADGRMFTLDPFADIYLHTAPERGMGASVTYPSDRYGYVIRRVGARWIEVTELKPVETVAYRKGPWPVIEHVYTDEERANVDLWGRTAKAWLRKDGRYWLGDGAPMTIGKAVYRRDYSD